MPQEIERKFLLNAWPPEFDGRGGVPIEQGYLAAEPHGVQVRLRRKGEKTWLTCKRGNGTVREEREIELSQEQFDLLWPLTEGRRLFKRRHEVPCGRLVIEIDVYEGANRGLAVTEVEFETEEEARLFSPPGWLGEDVSGVPQYSNPRLARE